MSKQLNTACIKQMTQPDFDEKSVIFLCRKDKDKGIEYRLLEFLIKIK